MALLGLASLLAAALLQEPEFRGELSLEGQLDSDGVQAARATVDVNAEGETPFGNFTLVGRLVGDGQDRLLPSGVAAMNAYRSDVNKRISLADTAFVELREAYFDLDVAGAFIRAGKQQIVWGSSDGLRVLDQINPMSLEEFVLPEYEDRRIPLWSIKAEVYQGASTFQFIWIPDHTYDALPARSAAFAPTSPYLVPASGNAGLVELSPPRRPEDLISDDDFGVRWLGFVGGWDLSLAYLYHYQDQPVLSLDAGAGDPVVTPQYRRTHLIGATFATAIESVTLRGEAGLSTDRFFTARSPEAGDLARSSPELSFVLGADWRVDGDTLVSGQVFSSALADHDAAMIRDRLEWRASLLLERKWANQTWTGRVLAIASINDGDGLVQADLSHQLTTNVAIEFGADWFFGAEAGLFGQFQARDRIRAGLTRSF